MSAALAEVDHISCHAGRVHDPAHDLITLVVPADASYARVARIGVAAIALRRGFSFHEIHDLRLAMDETLILLLGEHDQEGSITVRFVVSDDRVDIDAETSYEHRKLAGSGAVERYEILVASLVDAYEVDLDSGQVKLTKISD